MTTCWDATHVGNEPLNTRNYAYASGIVRPPPWLFGSGHMLSLDNTPVQKDMLEIICQLKTNGSVETSDPRYGPLYASIGRKGCYTHRFSSFPLFANNVSGSVVSSLRLIDLQQERRRRGIRESYSLTS